MSSTFQNIQIPAPFQNDMLFEDFTKHYFNELHKTTSYSLFGRNGQNQAGIDVISFDKKVAIQCKLRVINNQNDKTIKRNLIIELKKDFKSFLIYIKENNLPFNKYIFASTYKDDVDIITECFKLSQEHGVSVEYWSWSRLTSSLPDATRKEYYSDIEDVVNNYYNEYEYSQPLILQYEFDHSTHLIDQIYNYFQYIYNQLGYIPINILKNNYPFKTSESYYSQYSLFTLTTDNLELFELLKSLDITEKTIKFLNKELIKNVKNPLKKMKEILSILSSQLIFNIRQNKNRETINIRYSLNKSCDCVLCLLDSLQYQKLVQKLTKIPKGLENILICAFTHYQIGNYLISAKYYENSTKQAEKLNKPLLLAATQYSLSKLHNHINNNYWDNNRDDLLIKRLKGISLEGTLRKVNRKDRQFITWIFNTNFFTTTFEQITILVSKIRDNYYNQLNGGHSSNSHVWLLINKYAELESFLTLNRIPYNRFIEFNELSKIFIDGLFLSHAIRSKESSKLNEFDDWTIQKILFYGKSSDIKMYFYRYEMAELKYTTSSTKDSTFISLVNNFLENPNIVIPQFENGGNANYRFWDHYMKIFNNILILLAIIDLDVKVVLITGERLFNFLEKFKSYDDSYIDNLELFLRRKGQMLNLPTLSNYLNLYSTDQIYHNSWYVNTVLKQIIEKDDKLILNQILQEELIKNELDICNLCKTEHYTPILPDIYRIINNKVFKNKIKDAVETKLTQKFKTNLYYEYAINDVINYKIFLDKFIEGIPTTVNHANLNYLSDFDNNQCLNNLINLCYKNNVNLKDPNYQAFRGKSDYYDWLLNLNDFDYKKFNPNWVTAYPTIYYYREFAKYPIIKHQLVKILSTEKNIKVEKALIEIVKAETEIFKTN